MHLTNDQLAAAIAEDLNTIEVATKSLHKHLHRAQLRAQKIGLIETTFHTESGGSGDDKPNAE